MPVCFSCIEKVYEAAFYSRLAVRAYCFSILVSSESLCFYCDFYDICGVFYRRIIWFDGSYCQRSCSYKSEFVGFCVCVSVAFISRSCKLRLVFASEKKVIVLSVL